MAHQAESNRAPALDPVRKIFGTDGVRGVANIEPVTQRNMRVREKHPLGELPKVLQLLAETEKDLAGAGCVLLRYSGMEPKIRPLVDGDRINTQADRIADMLQEAIGEVV